MRADFGTDIERPETGILPPDLGRAGRECRRSCAQRKDQDQDPNDESKQNETLSRRMTEQTVTKSGASGTINQNVL